MESQPCGPQSSMTRAWTTAEAWTLQTAEGIESWRQTKSEYQSSIGIGRAHYRLSRCLWNKERWPRTHRNSILQDRYRRRPAHLPATTQTLFSEASRGKWHAGGHEEQRGNWGGRQSFVIACGAHPEERRQSSLLRRLPKIEPLYK